MIARGNQIRYHDDLPRLESEETELRRPIARLPAGAPSSIVIEEITLHPGEAEPTMDRLTDPLEDRRSAPRQARATPKKRRGWGRVIALLTVITLILAAILVAVGGAGAVIVAGGAVAGWLLWTTPVIDIQFPVTAPGQDPRQGEAGAELVIMPDPGFRPTEPRPSKKLGSSLP